MSSSNPNTNASASNQTGPGLIGRALGKRGEESALKKSIRLQQLDHLSLITDRMAGLEENRRSVKEYNLQSDRALKSIVDERFGTQPGNDAMPEEDENISNNLGDTFNEVHNHYQNTETAKKGLSPVVAGLVGSALGATGIGAVGAGLLAASSLLFQQETPKIDPGRAQATVELYYRRSDGTLVPLDGAETPEGAAIDVTVP